ncbi:MAG: hypothetical protein M3550_12245, partial [Actinomycetota bacterium]|nr:hypothetical protein [Actinomycetota bacterium]
VWHAWGDQMAGALSEAGQALHDRALIRSAVAEAGAFIPHVLAQGGGEGGWTPAPSDRSQIAYGADALLQNLLRTARASGRRSFSRLAGIAAAWYFGNNPAGRRIYDRATGRTFDGIEADGKLNPNSGAESTIHGLLSMIALDGRPRVRTMALRARRAARESWRLLEAESGVLSGAAELIEPQETATDEGAFSGNGYVRLAPGGALTLRVRLAHRRRFRALPAFWRQAPLRALGTVYRFGGKSFGDVWQGGAGPRGVTPEPGYLDDRGRGLPVDFDALLLEPEIERLLLSAGGATHGILRSAAPTRRLVRLRLGPGLYRAFAYDARGRLRERATGSAGRLAAPVVPGGFTYLLGARRAG